MGLKIFWRCLPSLRGWRQDRFAGCRYDTKRSDLVPELYRHDRKLLPLQPNTLICLIYFTLQEFIMEASHHGCHGRLLSPCCCRRTPTLLIPRNLPFGIFSIFFREGAWLGKFWGAWSKNMENIYFAGNCKKCKKKHAAISALQLRSFLYS